MQRRPATGLTLSAVALAGWLAYEGFTATAVIPTHGDRPTVCSGLTHWEDGRPVRMGDTCTREQARTVAGKVLESKYCEAVRRTLGSTPVSQVEFDIACDFAGQYGTAAWASSSMLRQWLAGDYYPGCESFLKWRMIYAETPGNDPRWRKVGSGRWQFDCALPGNRECGGVWKRQQERYTKCAMQ